MKNIVAGALISLMALPIIEQDKMLHFTTSFALGAALQRTMGRTNGTITALALGVLKELADKQFDQGDLAADVIGVGLTLPFEF